MFVCLQDLTLQRVLGVGGFGTVYQGLWKGSTAAVKVKQLLVAICRRSSSTVTQCMLTVTTGAGHDSNPTLGICK